MDAPLPFEELEMEIDRRLKLGMLGTDGPQFGGFAGLGSRPTRRASC
jgi:hypothetical protein